MLASASWIARKTGDPLRGRERVGLATDLEVGLDAGALGEGVDLAMEDLAERTADHALRLERVGDLAQVAVELDEPCGEVVEAAGRLFAVPLEHERVDLLLEEADVRGEREDVLDRAVVEVEAEPHEAALRGGDERPLARCGVLEEVLALDRGPEGRRDDGEERVGDVRLDRAEPPDDAAYGLP